jgi:Flp pilus assembly protein TadD
MSEKSKTRVSSLFSKLAGNRHNAPLIRWAFFALLIILPVIYIPGEAGTYSAIKHLVLVISVSLALFGWSVHMYRTRALQLRDNYWLWIPGLLLIGVVLSAIASPSGYLSWVGMGSLGFTSVVPTFAFVILYAILVHSGDHTKVLRFTSLGAMIGVALAGLVATLSYFGVMPDAVSIAGLSPSGTPESLTIMLVVMTVFAMGIWVADDHKETDVWLPTNQWRISHLVVWSLLLIETLFWVAITDTSATLIVLVVGSGVFVALGLYQPKRFKVANRMIVPMIALALALFLLLVPSPFAGSVPSEIGPSMKAGSSIAHQTWKADGIFLGSGPATFAYDFSRFKPLEINNTSLWNVKFDRSLSHILNLSATWGLFPTVVYVGFMIWLLWAALHALVIKKVKEDWQTIAVLSSVWLMTVVAQAVYASDIVLTALFWMFSGLLVSAIVPQMRRVSFANNQRIALLTSMLFVSTGILFLLSLAAATQWFSGEVIINRAESLVVSDPEKSLEAVRSATVINPWNADYQRMYALGLLRGVERSIQNGDEVSIVQEKVERAAIAANRAVSLEPMQAGNHEMRRLVYASITSFAQGADRLALDSSIMAQRLDPTNPIRHMRVSRSFIVAAEQAAVLISDEGEREATVGALLGQAESAIEQAISLRSSYAPLYYTRGLIYDRQGRLDEAISQLSRLVIASPNDAVLRFELGVLQLRAGNTDKSRMDFEAALKIEPTFSNAKWYLSSVYELDERFEDAIRQLEDIAILDPKNIRVQQRIDLIRAGIVPEEAEEIESLEPLE